MDEYGVIYALSVDGRDFRYVGLTKRTIAVRWKQHKQTAARGGRWPISCWIRKHGAENISVTVLSYVRIDELCDAERWWIAELRGLGYQLLNLTEGGEGNFGWVPTAETRVNMSAGASASMTAERRAVLAAARVGKLLSEETKEKISKAQRGHPAYEKSAEGRARISATHKGKKHTAEHNAKISAALRGRVPTNETRAKISVALTGKRQSEEHRAAHSAALKGKPQSEEHKAAVRAGKERARTEGRIKPRSEEAKMSAASKNRGRKRSDETRAKISAARRATVVRKSNALTEPDTVT